jgi:monofunctional biosynthetic peptidoglycan transglycosylase
MAVFNDSPFDDPTDPPVRKGFLRTHPLLIAALSLLLAFCGYLTYLTVSLPDVEFLRKKNPDATSLMKQRFAEARARGEEPRRLQYWIPLSHVSERVTQAVIMGEDAAFFTHPGFDFYEIRESILKNFERGKYVRGASTITQQLAKNLFLSTDKSLNRKLKEAILTHRLERALTKKRILEIYLNVIEWGDGIYGIEAAARTYFGKPAAYLDPAEAALLAAMIPNPRELNPATRLKSLKVRQERILRWMLKAGYLIDDAEFERAKEQPLNLKVESST